MNMKRFICLLLTVVMLVCLALPVSVFAEDDFIEEVTEEEDDPGIVNDDSDYSDDYDEGINNEEPTAGSDEDNDPEEPGIEDQDNAPADPTVDENQDADVPEGDEENEDEDEDDENAKTLEGLDKSALAVTKPDDQEVAVGARASFSVTASGGTEPYSYHWQYRTTGAWRNLSGATSATYTIIGTAARNGVQFRCVVTDDAGASVESEAATLTVIADNPLTVTKPDDQEVAVGARATFSVTASGGTSPYTYQWKYKTPTGTWKTLSGGTKATYTVVATAAKNGIQLRCVVTDNAGASVESEAATLTVIASDPLTVTKPDDQEAAVGARATFSVTASGGTSPYTYQWKYKTPTGTWKTLSGATKATYTVVATAAKNGIQLRCVVTDAAGASVESEAATLTVLADNPLTVTKPDDQEVAVNARATFSVTASGGTSPYTYQWKYKTPTGTWKTLSGGTKATYTVVATAAKNGIQLRCVVTDNAGASVESEAATLTVLADNPLAVTKPDDQEVAVNARATFSVTASGGTSPYTYQWKYKTPTGTWKTLSGGTKATYTVVATAAKNGIQLRCVVTDAAGASVESEAATLTVIASDPLAVTKPDDQEVAVDARATFSVTASGGLTPYTYQWKYKTPTGTWKTLSGATKATYTVVATAAKNGIQLRCVVTDAAGARVESEAATLTVLTDITEGDFVYELIDGSTTDVAVKEYTADAQSVVVPSTVENGKYTVKAIGEGAFAGKSLSEISLPNGIELIAKQAFMNCSNLSKMTCHD